MQERQGVNEVMNTISQQFRENQAPFQLAKVNFDLLAQIMDKVAGLSRKEVENVINRYPDEAANRKLFKTFAMISIPPFGNSPSDTELTEYGDKHG